MRIIAGEDLWWSYHLLDSYSILIECSLHPLMSSYCDHTNSRYQEIVELLCELAPFSCCLSTSLSIKYLNLVVSVIGTSVDCKEMSGFIFHILRPNHTIRNSFVAELMKNSNWRQFQLAEILLIHDFENSFRQSSSWSWKHAEPKPQIAAKQKYCSQTSLGDSGGIWALFWAKIWISYMHESLSFHSRVDGLMMPNSSSFATAFGFKSLNIGLLFWFI